MKFVGNLCCIIFSAITLQAQSLYVGEFNIRNDNANDTEQGNGWAVNITAMVLFGISIGVLICFLGGLMAVDIVPRKATGAALGVVGMASYVAAGIQDVVSGWLIDGNSTLVETLDEATGQMVQAT